MGGALLIKWSSSWVCRFAVNLPSLTGLDYDIQADPISKPKHIPTLDQVLHRHSPAMTVS